MQKKQFYLTLVVMVLCFCGLVKAEGPMDGYVMEDPGSWLQHPWGYEEADEIPADYAPPSPAGNVKYGYADFDAFFERFAEDEAFQRAAIKYPLKISYTDADVDTLYLLAPQEGWPPECRVFPNEYQRKYDGLLLDFDLKGTAKIVILRQEDSGLRLEYKFGHAKSGYWFLEEIQHSLM